MVHGSSDMECNRRNFCHFRLLFALLPPNSPKNQNLKKMKKHLEISSVYTSVPKIMIICYTVPYIWHVTDLIVFFILGYFLPFYLPSSPKNHDHMLYWSWGMVHDGCNYFSFWVIFCPFTLLTAPKIKILENEKNIWRYHHFTNVPKIMIICYTVPEIWCVTDVIVIIHFGLFFAILPL